MKDLTELFLGIILGSALVLTVTFVVYDLRDHSECDGKKGVYHRGLCFKKEVIQE